SPTCGSPWAPAWAWRPRRTSTRCAPPPHGTSRWPPRRTSTSGSPTSRSPWSRRPGRSRGDRGPPAAPAPARRAASRHALPPPDRHRHQGTPSPTYRMGRDCGSAWLRCMLRIDLSIYGQIVAYARRRHPDEACGHVDGAKGSDRPEPCVEMINADRSPTFYRFDSLEQLKVWREMDERGEEPVVIYHSHTATEAYPSRTDVSYASEPNAHYVLVSTRDPDTVEFRSYRIVDGVVTEEPVEIVDQG